MAGVSTKEIKNRIRSMRSTGKITKAMEMVASSKLRHAQARVIASRPYFALLSQAISDIVKSNKDFSSPYLEKREIKHSVYVVIAGDRGLAGGYNSNILKLAVAQSADKNVTYLPIGKKAVEFFRSRNLPMLTDCHSDASAMQSGTCFSIAKQLAKSYLAGQIDEVAVYYTDFVSVLSQNPTGKALLPLTPPEGAAPAGQDILYEPDSETVFASLVPEYLGGMLFGALCESRAAEQAARRNAMDSATRNAEDMIDHLSLQYNQARQAAITQEITEIVAGS